MDKISRVHSEERAAHGYPNEHVILGDTEAR
jgi:hypothetical protein